MGRRVGRRPERSPPTTRPSSRATTTMSSGADRRARAAPLGLITSTPASRSTPATLPNASVTSPARSIARFASATWPLAASVVTSVPDGHGPRDPDTHPAGAAVRPGEVRDRPGSRSGRPRRRAPTRSARPPRTRGLAAGARLAARSGGDATSSSSIPAGRSALSRRTPAGRAPARRSRAPRRPAASGASRGRSCPGSSTTVSPGPPGPRRADRSVRPWPVATRPRPRQRSLPTGTSPGRGATAPTARPASPAIRDADPPVPRIVRLDRARRTSPAATSAVAYCWTWTPAARPSSRGAAATADDPHQVRRAAGARVPRLLARRSPRLGPRPLGPPLERVDVEELGAVERQRRQDRRCRSSARSSRRSPGRRSRAAAARRASR